MKTLIYTSKKLSELQVGKKNVERATPRHILVKMLKTNYEYNLEIKRRTI